MIKILLEVEGAEAVCLRCRCSALKRIDSVTREFGPGYAGGRLVVGGWGLPDGWENFSFLNMWGVLCPGCVRVAGPWIIEAMKAPPVRQSGYSDPPSAPKASDETEPHE